MKKLYNSISNRKVKKVFIATHVIPYPPGAGNEFRIYGLLRFLADNGLYTCLLIRPLESESIAQRSIEKLKELVTELHVFDKNVESNHIYTTGDFITPDPDFVDVSLSKMQDIFCPIEFLEHAEKLMTRFVPDVVIIEYIFMSRILLLHSAKNTINIIDTHDIFYHKLDDAKKCGFKATYPTREQEVKLLERGDVIMAIQQKEKDIFQTMVPRRKVILAGVDFNSTPPKGPGEPGRVLIVASDNNFNVVGTQHFIDCIWPKIASSCPTAHLHIVGKVCSHIRLRGERIVFLGFIEDLEEEYRNAKVVVNPTPVGTGLKIKSVEALARSKPHVAWPVAADGLNELSSSVPMVIAHDDDTFADAVLQFLWNDNFCMTIAKEAHYFMQKYFSPSAAYKELCDELGI